MAQVDEAFRLFMSGIASGLDALLNESSGPPKVGFALFTFNFGDFSDGQVNYVSNADRQTMIAAVEEWLARAKQGEGVIYSPTKPCL